MAQDQTPPTVAPESTEDVKIEQPEGKAQEQQTPPNVPYNRFKEVNEEKQALKLKLETIETERLTEQGKYKELFESSETKFKTLQDSMNQERINASLVTELAKHNPSSIDVAKRLIDVQGLTVGEDGSVMGVQEAVAKVIQEVPQLFTVTPPANAGVKVPTGEVGSRSFTLSEIQDPVFRNANWEAIEKASKEKRIDMTK